MNKSQMIKMAFAEALMSFGADLEEQINSRLPTKRRIKEIKNKIKEIKNGCK